MRKKTSEDRVLKVLPKGIHKNLPKRKNSKNVNTKNKSKTKSLKHKNKHNKTTTHKNLHKVHHVTVHKKQPIHRQYASKFCPKCGKPMAHEDAFCKKCSPIDFDFKEIKIFLCTNCGSYNYKNKWQKLLDIDELLEMTVLECVKHHATYHPLSEEKAEELLSYKAGVHKNFTVEISIGKEHYELPAVIDVTLCPKCSKQGTKYFEGVLQVRNSTNEINSFIKNDLLKQKSKGIHVNKVVDLDGSGYNVDYYYTDKGYLKIIAEKLRNSFGAVIKHNAQLFSIDWETSKNLYRLNVLVEFPAYHKGEVIKIGKNLYKIISMDEKIHVTNLETHTKTLLPHKQSYDVLKPVEVMLIKKYPEFEVLDPNTYYQARLMNPSDKLEINQSIRVVVDGGEAWMI